jgi:chromosome partitioning protein
LLDEVIRRSEDFPKTLSDEEDLPPLCLAKPTSDASEELRAVAKALLTKMGVTE